MLKKNYIKARNGKVTNVSIGHATSGNGKERIGCMKLRDERDRETRGSNV